MTTWLSPAISKFSNPPTKELPPPVTVKVPAGGRVCRVASLPVQLALSLIAACSSSFEPSTVLMSYTALSISFNATALTPLVNPPGRPEVAASVALACQTPAPSALIA